MEKKEKGNSEKDLVCVFLGLELYTTKKAAGILKANVMELLRTDLKEIPVLAVKSHEPINLTPDFTTAWEKIRSLISRPSQNPKPNENEPNELDKPNKLHKQGLKEGR